MIGKPWCLGSLLICLATGATWAEPAAPVAGPRVARLELGVLCHLHTQRKRPEPGVASGWIHIPEGEVTFHWPDRQTLPGVLGLAFGVKARLQAGDMTEAGTLRILPPDNRPAEIWEATLDGTGEATAFFRFDHAHEIALGLWRVEGWDGGERLFSVEFEVVPAEDQPGLTQACGAVS